MVYKDFFWLHIKKSAGIHTRDLLQPHHTLVEDRTKKPKNFIQANPKEYNDILNNYRVVLGEYQFKRVLFATKYLYPDNWDSLFSFAFSREPVERCVSMFYYLHRKKSLMARFNKQVQSFKKTKKIGLSEGYDFDLFLDLVELAHINPDSNSKPKGLHFSTHTAPMFNDITDLDGNVLLKKVYRIEDLTKGIQQVFEACGLEWKPNKSQNIRVNKNVNKGGYKPNEAQRQKIRSIYEKDFELYESAAKNTPK